jgi:hypothetical protein
MRTQFGTLVWILAMLAACSSEGKQTVDATVDAYDSDCGRPGDVGNELGIGKFCESISDCSTTQSAPLCSSLGSDRTHFCTRTCTMGSTTQCGTDTMCICNAANQCGCTPSVCLQ